MRRNKLIPYFVSAAFKEILKLGKEYLEDMDEDGSDDSDDEENGSEA
jgi:hypothetical protein